VVVIAAFALPPVLGQVTVAAQQRPPLPPGSSPAQGIQLPTPRLPGEGGQPLNVKVDVTIADQTGITPGFKKTMSVTVADRQSGSIRSRIDVPVPTTSYAPVVGSPSPSGTDKEKPAGAPPTVNWSYRSLGLNLDVREITIEGSYVRLRLTLEYSPLDEKVADADPKMTTGALPPGIANFQQTLSLVLENGKPLVVAQTSDPVPTRDRKQTVEVKATILK
jgi:hypothetical protein